MFVGVGEGLVTLSYLFIPQFFKKILENKNLFHILG